MSRWNRSFSRTVVLGLLANFLVAVPDRMQAASRGEDVADFGTIESGVLFVNGLYIPAPYHLQATDDHVRINGQEIDPGVDIDWGDAEGEAPEGSRGRRGGRGFRSGQRRFGGPRRGFGPGWPGVEDPEHYFSPEGRAERVADSLNADEVVVLFDGQPLRSLTFASQQYDLLKAVSQSSRSTQQIQIAIGTAQTPQEKELWTEWLQSMETTPELEALIGARLQFIDDAEQRGLSEIAATARLEKLSYPLTLVGMLMGVFAFGHMLQWIGRGLGGENAASQESQRFVVVALGLMFGMSLLDVLWTVLAGQAGAMRELNPIAAQFIDSPLKLALFKAVATAVGFSILYAWRQRKQIQHATWWMCLVCVLLTFRWVMFDSMIN